MIETLWNFFRLYTADADYLPDFWLTMILLYLNAGLYLSDLYNLVKRKSKSGNIQSDGDTRSLCSNFRVDAINFCACAESSEHSFTGQTPEPDHNDNAATNEPCAASYCISLSNSMGNRALTTEEA